MTIEMTGLVASQNRIAELQTRMGLMTSGATTTLTSNTTAFDASMRGALATTSAAAGTQRATTAAPFVYDPTAAPGQVKAKPGAAQALAAAVATAAAPTASKTSSAATAVATTSVARTSAARPVAAASAATGAARIDEVIADAKKYLGTPYLWGGTNPAKGLDCSGFTQLVFKQNGVSLPRVARDQQKEGTKVPSLAQARPGDLITFGNPAHHIGIYLGNNKFIHAPHTGDVVKISTVYRTPSSIRRVLPDSAWQAGSGSAASGSTATSTVTGAAAAVKGAGASAPAATTATRAVTTAAALTNASRAAAASIAGPTTARAGWAGAPAADTWGAASAQAATLGVAALTAGAPGEASARSAATAAATSPATLTTARARRAPAVTTQAASITSSGVLAQAPVKYRPLFTAAAAKYGVPADLLAAVAKQESNFKPNAVSHAGARGLMQLMPGTARGLGVKNSFDPAQAVDGAARLLRDHLKTFKGSTELALAAYNAGPGAVRRYGGVPPYGETQNYVRKIMANLRASAA